MTRYRYVTVRWGRFAYGVTLANVAYWLCGWEGVLIATLGVLDYIRAEDRRTW